MALLPEDMEEAIDKWVASKSRRTAHNLLRLIPVVVGLVLGGFVAVASGNMNGIIVTPGGWLLGYLILRERIERLSTCDGCGKRLAEFRGGWYTGHLPAKCHHCGKAVE